MAGEHIIQLIDKLMQFTRTADSSPLGWVGGFWNWIHIHRVGWNSDPFSWSVKGSYVRNRRFQNAGIFKIEE